MRAVGNAGSWYAKIAESSAEKDKKWVAGKTK